MQQTVQRGDPGLMESAVTEGEVSSCPSSADIWSVLPEQLKAVSVVTEFPKQRHRWNTNEEVASLLLAFDKHQQWIQKEVVPRPPSGTMLFYLKNLKASQRYRKDGYYWKKRRDGSTTREDHMKLKVQGVECIYGCYVHSAILPTFHRRSYWLLQNPDMVLVHYLNVPLTEETPLPPLTIQRHKTQWSEDQLLAQLRPMFTQGNQNDAQKSTCMSEETIRSVAQRLLESQRRVDCYCSNVCKCNNCRACKQKRLPPQLVTYLSQRATSPNGEQMATKVTPQGETYHSAPIRSNNIVGAMQQTHEQHHRSDASKKPPKNVLIKPGTKAHGTNKPFILNLSQLQGNNSLIILSSSAKSSAPMTIIARKPQVSTSHCQNIAQNPAAAQFSGQSTGIVGNLNPAHNRNIAPTLTSHHQNPHQNHHQNHHQPAVLVSQGQILNAINSQGHHTQGQMFNPGEQEILRSQVQEHSILQNNQQSLLNGQQNVSVTSQGHSNNSAVPSQVLSDSLLYTPGHTMVNGQNAASYSQFSSNHQLGPSEPSQFSSNHQLGPSEPSQFSSNHQLGPSEPSQFSSNHQLGPSEPSQFSSNHQLGTNEPRRHSEGSSHKSSSSHAPRPQRAFTISDPAELNFISSLMPTSDMLCNDAVMTTVNQSGHCSNNTVSQTGSYGNNTSLNQNINYGNLTSQTGSYGNTANHSSNYGNLSSHQSGNYGISANQHNHQSHIHGNNTSVNPNTSVTFENTIHNHVSTSETARAQMVESDMAVDFLIQELNMKNSVTNESTSSFSDNLNNTNTSSAFEDVCSITDSQTSVSNGHNNIPMQISPSSPDLNLDDFVDLTFLDTGIVSQAEAQLANSSTCSSTNVTMITTSSPISSVGDYHSNKKESCNQQHMIGGNITDFCPEWSYTKGAAKVLVTGPWNEDSGSYAVLFDGVAVPATVVQKGVLRCYCPDHHPGEVTLEVACNGRVISNSVAFEYRTKQEEHTEDTDWFNVEEYQLRTWLLERLQAIESCLSTEGAVGLSTKILTKPQRDIVENLELRVIECVQQLHQKSWPRGGETQLPQLTTHTLSLIHLAAALGYHRLILALLGWKSDKSSPVLESEVDLLGVDINECTPLAWSCAHGHQDAVSTLYNYNPGALKLKNRDGHNAIDIARQRGHSNIATKLWSLEKARLKSLQNIPPLVLQPSDDDKGSESDGSLLLADTSGTRSDVDSQIFKVPASPVQSTPKTSLAKAPTAQGNSAGGKGGTYPNNTAPAMLSIDIPQDNTLQVTPRSRKAHDSRRSRLLKRISVEVLPDYPPSSDPSKGGKLEAVDLADLHQVRAKSLTLEEMQDPQLNWGSEGEAKVYNDPMFSMNGRDLNSPVMFMPMMESQPIGLTLQDIQQHTAMETESSCNTSCSSSLGDTGLEDIIDSVSTQDVSTEGQGNQMATLANQIIAAIPERIKASPSRSDELVPEEANLRRDRSSSYSSFSSCSSTADQPPVTEDSGISTPLDTPLEGIAFEDYRYVDLGTPASSHSPASSLHSPYVDHFNMDSPPPTTEEFNEYFNAPQTYMEKDFSQLTLSDTEQRKLYEAAKIIQNFFRRFKDRKEQQMLQRQRELQAAILIQSYYRRYKQYLYYKKMTVAATLIQSQFRSYYAQKRFRQSREAATLIQNRYRAYKEQERYRKRKDAAVLIQQRFRNHYQRKHNRKGDKSSHHGDAADSCKEEVIPTPKPEGTRSCSTPSDRDADNNKKTTPQVANGNRKTIADT